MIKQVVEWVKEFKAFEICEFFVHQNFTEKGIEEFTSDVWKYINDKEDNMTKFRLFFLLVKGMEKLEDDRISGRYDEDDTVIEVNELKPKKKGPLH